MLTQKELDNLQKIYLAARNNLLNTIINTGGVGTKTYYNTVLKQLEKEIAKLQEVSTNYIDTSIPTEYKEGLNEVYNYFKKNNLTMNKPSMFASIHTEAVYEIAREMQYQISQGIAQAGRQVLRYLDESRDEALRQIGLEAAGKKIASGSTILDMKKNMLNKLKRQGFMTVQYGRGPNAYQVSLDSYAMMVARSTTREAGNIARENQLIENGYDLVEMTEHYPTCEVCAQYQGRIYSISGKDKRFPPLSIAFSNGYHNIHPNCRHSIVPWIETLKTDEEIKNAVSKSNASFKDSRTKKEVDLYNKQQYENRQMRKDLYQYEQYKANLGEDAPKTFSSFRKLKKLDSEAWELTQLDYKRRSKLIKHTDLALPNASTAVADDGKFGNYLFNPKNVDGWAKGVAIESRLGYNKSNWKEFQKEILKRASMYPTSPKYSNEYGNGYEQKIIMYGNKGKAANVIVGWLEKDGHTKMTSCYIKEVK